MNAAKSESQQLYEEVTPKWPDVALSAERFQSAWARLSDTKEGPEPAHAGDLFLVVACLDGDRAALRRLEQLIQSLLPQLAGFGLGANVLQTLARDTLSKLLSGEGGPRLARYSARGPLAGWLHVVMSRQALDLKAESTSSDVALDDVLMGSLGDDGAPELELIREQFRGSFSEAFRAAIGRLTARQRNLLRQYYLDTLSLEELGLLYRTHRSTIARWLADARTSVLELMRDEVSARLGIGRLDVDSIIRVVGSWLDVSAGLFLSQSQRLGRNAPTRPSVSNSPLTTQRRFARRCRGFR